MIQVSGLTKVYGPRQAISELNFEVKKGEIIGFLGPNGAGKSTTMKIISGFMPATMGTVKVAGFDVFEDPMEVKRRVGYLPENPPVYLEMTVRKYLEFVGRLNGIKGKKLSSAVDDVMEKTALKDVQKRLIGNLSKGYRQRVGLAQALVHNPDVLILDEPTVGLDPSQIREIRNLIKGLGGNHTIILSSHILPEVTATCERIIVISKGKIVAQDTLEQLTRRLKKGMSYGMIVKDMVPAGIEALQKISGVSHIAKDTNFKNKLLIDIRPEAGEIRDQIIQKAFQSGMAVLEFSSEKLSLEEIFLELTTDEGGVA